LNFTRIGGQTELALALAATGRSQREMIASLRGAAEIKITDGAIRGIDLEGMLESVAQKILVGWSGEAGRTSDFQLLKASFKISDGIAETTDFELVGPRLRLTGKGLLDLPKAEIDFKVAPDLEAGNAHGIAVPVVASGSWGKPRFYPDIAGVLENPKAAYETLKALVGRAKLDEPGADLVHGGKNAGGVAGETLSGETGEAGPAPTVDLIKKELNTNTLELMNGFAGEAPPQPVATDQ
jgi:AsmA protein